MREREKPKRNPVSKEHSKLLSTARMGDVRRLWEGRRAEHQVSARLR